MVKDTRYNGLVINSAVVASNLWHTFGANLGVAAAESSVVAIAAGPVACVVCVLQALLPVFCV